MKFHDIVNAIKNKIEEIDGLEDRVLRSYTTQIEPDTTPYILIFLENDTLLEQVDTNHNERELSVSIDIIISTENAEEDLSPYIQSIYTKLVEDRSLGGLALNVQLERLEWRLSSGENNPICLATNSFLVRYRTQYNTL